MTTSKAWAQVCSINACLSSIVRADSVEAVRPGVETIDGEVRPGDTALDCRPGEGEEKRPGK